MSEEVNEPVFDEDVDQIDQETKAPTQEVDDTPVDKTVEDKPVEDKTKTEDPKEEKDPPQVARKRRRTQAYINNLKREAEAAKEQAAYFRGQVEALKTQNTPEPKRPARDDFESEDDYLDAVLDYREDQRANKKEETPGKPDQPSTDHSAPQDLIDKNNRMFEAGLKTYGDDFIAALNDNELFISPTMGEYTLDSEVGADVYMHLADNPEEAERIFNLKTKADQIRALDAIEAGIKGVNSSVKEEQADPSTQVPETKPTPPTPPQRKVTQAPPPVNHEKGSAVPDIDEAKLSDDEWFKREQARVTG